MEIMNNEKMNGSEYSQIEPNDIIECINSEFDEFIIAIKSTYNGELHWIVTDGNDPDVNAFYVGTVITGVLNHINHQEYPQNPSNNEYCEKLIEVINNKGKYSLHELSEYNKKYRYLPYCLLSSKSFKDFYDGKESCPFTYSIQNIEKNYDRGELHEKYRLNNYFELFMLDLEEVLFNKKCPCKIKYCRDCNTAIWISHLNQEYCPYCQENKSKRDYQNYCKNNEINALVKSIHQRFCNKAHARELYLQSNFDSELHYYQDIVQAGKSDMKVEPYYRSDIKTDEDLIKWLREKDDSLRVRKPYRKKEALETPGEVNNNG